MTEPVLVPREPGPFTLLGDRPQVGYWVMGARYETIRSMVWWRCPDCQGLVPFDSETDVDAEGNVADAVHQRRVEKGQPTCSWTRPLRLADYEAS